MASNLFDRLADLEVPPPPAQFDQQLHERVNRSLVVGHVVNLVFDALPWALTHFARALVGAATYTLAGRYEIDPKHKPRR